MERYLHIARSKIIIVHVCHVHYRLPSVAFTRELFRKFLSSVFSSSPRRRARFHRQASQVQTVPSRNSIVFRAAHGRDRADQISHGASSAFFFFFHLFISDKSLACGNFVPIKFHARSNSRSPRSLSLSLPLDSALVIARSVFLS